MGVGPKLGAAAIMAVAWLGFCNTVTMSIPNTQIKSVLCNSRVYSKGDPFGVSLVYIVEELESDTPSSNTFDYYNISPYPNAFAYGHASCTQNLTSSDCGTCLLAAKTAMFATCPSTIGARSVLSDCTIRYEQYPFDD